MLSLGKQLHAQNNGLGPEGAKSFGSMLEHNNTLTLLDLSDNQMKAEGAAALADGLKANSTIQQLDASSNAMGVDGGKAIAASIAENRTITSVSYQQKAFSSTFLTCLSLPLVSAFSILWGK